MLKIKDLDAKKKENKKWKELESTFGKKNKTPMCISKYGIFGLFFIAIVVVAHGLERQTTY